MTRYNAKRNISGKFVSTPTLADNREWLYQKYVVERTTWQDFLRLYGISHDILKSRLKKFKLKRKRTGWNSGTRGVMKPNTGSFKKGHNKGIRFGRDKSSAGKNHTNWRGGITSEHTKIRTSSEGMAWRDSVFKRDKFTCQECGQVGGKLQADHIKPFAYFAALRFDINNGRTLCVECHKKTDTYGRKAEKLYGFGGVAFS